MKRLIVTGDDFGVSIQVNDAIEESHRRGVLSTASLMVGGEAMDDAVARARVLPSLRVGLHVVVVRGKPTLPAGQVPDLVDERGNFDDRLFRAGVRYFAHPRVRRQLEAEIRAQFERFAATRLQLDHVNGHNHLQLHPTVLSLIVKVGRDFGSPPIRLPREPFLPSWRATRTDLWTRLWNGVFLAPWIGLMKLRLRLAGVASNDYVFGLNDTGKMTADRVLRLLRNLPRGVTEMYFHPATGPWPNMDPAAVGGAFVAEFEALTSRAVADTIRSLEIQPYTFSRLAHRDGA